MRKKIALVVSFTVVLLFAFCITCQTVYVGMTFKKAIGNDYESSCERIAGAYSLALANKVNEYLAQVRVYAESDPVSSGNERQITDWLRSHTGIRRSYFSYVMFVNMGGDFYSDIGGSGDIRGTETYEAFSKKGKNEYISNPLVDSSSGKYVVHVGRAAKSQGKVIGYFVAVVPVENFQYMVNYIKVGANGSAWIVSDDGLIIAHQNNDYITKLNILSKSGEMGKVAGKLVAGGIGTGWVEEFSGNGTDFVSYSPIANTKWSLVISVPQKQIYASHDAVIPKLGLLNVVICLSVLLVAIITIGKILKPLTKVNESITNIATGSADLTNRIEISTNNEIGSVVKAFNGFTEKLQSIVKEIKNSEGELSNAGQELDVCSKGTSDSIDDILNKINTMKDCISQQSSGVGETVSSVNDITKVLSDFESLIEHQSAGVAQASTAVEEMMGNINAVNSSVERMATEFQGLERMAVDGVSKQSAVNERISLIESESEMLQEANAAIAAIAEQTNLLAMNAAIEAAHAGEAGKGFSVVADEIRKLSETSSDQSKTIGNQLQKIQESISSVVSASEASSQSFTSVVEGIKSTDAIVRQIRDAMMEQSEGSKQINCALRDMNDSTIDVRTASKDVAHSNQEILNQIRGLERSTDSMKINMAEMQSGANKIGEMGRSLSVITGKMRDSIDGIGQQISQFKV